MGYAISQTINRITEECAGCSRKDRLKTCGTGESVWSTMDGGGLADYKCGGCGC